MAVQTRACNNNRQIKTKQADETQSGNNNSSSRRSYHRRRNRGKTIPEEFLESARFSQTVEATDSTEVSSAVAKKSKAGLDNGSVQQPLTTAAVADSVKTSVPPERSAVATQEIKCKKSGKMFQYPGNFTNSTCTTSTLTPTTLRNIGDAFDYAAEVPPPLEHNLAAGFAPPSVIVSQPFNNNQRLQDDVEIKREITEEDAGYVPTPWTDPVNQQNVDMNIYQTPLPYTTASDVRPQLATTPSPRKRNQTTSPPQRETTTKRRIKDEGLLTEEEERKRQRRERNKLAAARCRQRRVDQTNELQNEVDLEEERKRDLLGVIEELKEQRKRLQLALDQHSCMQNDVSRNTSIPVTSQSSVSMGSAISGLPNIPVSQTIVSSPSQVNVIVRRDSLDSRLAEIVPTTLAAMPQQTEKRPRPSTLPMSMFEQTGVPIQTPSAVLYSFEGLVEGTGLTPGVTPIAFSPTCTIQQRNSNGDVSTPDTTPRKLVTL